MSLLNRLLIAREPLFDLTLKQLEDLTHRPGVDTALMGEVLAKGYQRAAELGLDADFNAKELYYSLQNRVKLDDERVAKQIGGADPEDVQEMLPLILKTAEGLKMHRDGWFIKPSVAKRFLRKMPPKQVMKRLGYKRIEEMLARESLYEIYGALRFAEDGKWLNHFLAQYRELTFQDFESRRIRLIKFDTERWGDIAADFIKKKLHNITHLKELGVVMVMPTGSLKRMPGITLKVLPLIIHYLYEIRLYSAYFKLVSVKENFGAIVVDTLIADVPNLAITERNHVHWRVIQRYFGKLHERHPEIFEPHVQPEDLHWRKAEEVLFELDPELRFWKDADYVGLELDEEIVSFNLMDVALSYSNQLRFEDRYLYHMRESLWNEIFMRYLGRDELKEQLLERLDNELIAPEKLVTKVR